MPEKKDPSTVTVKIPDPTLLFAPLVERMKKKYPEETFDSLRPFNELGYLDYHCHCRPKLSTS